MHLWLGLMLDFGYLGLTEMSDSAGFARATQLVVGPPGAQASGRPLLVVVESGLCTDILLDWVDA